MKKQGIGKLVGVGYSYGVVSAVGRSEAKDTSDVYRNVLEVDDYIIPESVKLKFYGEDLKPTQFDSHGNPQIGGVANLILMCKLRQKVRDGVIDSQCDGLVSYEYETTDSKPLTIPFDKRVSRVDVCPVCGERITINDLDGFKEITEGSGYVSTKYWAPRVEELRNFGTIVHKDCAKEFYRLRMIDEATETVDLAFDRCSIDKENRFTWGKDEHDMWYELIPNEYCSGVCCSHRPWFMFHTPIGDIKIGWHKGDTNITFMPNFAAFDMSIFDGEDVTKFVDENGAKTIHARDGKMYEYLVRVHDAVLLNEEK